MGECYPGYDPPAVRDAVVAALKLDDKRAARLFSGRRVVLRSGIDLPSAHRYIARLSAMGAVVHAEPPLPSPPFTAASGGPATARKTPRWRRRSLAAAGVVIAAALLLVPAAGRLWLGADPPHPAPPPATLPEPPPDPAPAPEPSTPPPTPPTSAAPPASPSDTPAVATRRQGDAGLPEDMTPEAGRDYRGHYLPAPGHKAFAISASRRHGWHTGAASAEEARELALDNCLAVLGPGDQGCRVIDEDGQLQE